MLMAKAHAIFVEDEEPGNEVVPEASNDKSVVMATSQQIGEVAANAQIY